MWHCRKQIFAYFLKSHKILFMDGFLKCKNYKSIWCSPFTELQLGGDVISDYVQSDNVMVGRPTRNRTQTIKMNISSNKWSTYDIAMARVMRTTQIPEAVKSKNPSLRKGLKVWGKRGLIFQKVTAQFDSGLWQCYVSATTYLGKSFFFKF